MSGSIAIWRCACGTLNDAPPAGDPRFCRGCRFEEPVIEATYIVVEVRQRVAADTPDVDPA